MSLIVATIFFVAGFVIFGFATWWATKNRDITVGVMACYVLSVVMTIATLAIFSYNAYMSGTGYCRSQRELVKGGIYKVNRVIEGVLPNSHVLVVNLLQERNLESGGLTWDRALFLEFKEMPPTPCFKVINAKESKYEEVEIAGVEKSE